MNVKLTDGKIEYLPAKVKYTDPTTKKTKTYKPAETAPAEVLKALGYKELVYGTIPEIPEGYTTKEVITENETQVIIGYELCEIPNDSAEAKKIALEQRLKALTENVVDVLGDCLYDATSTTKLTAQIKENADAMAVIKERKEVKVQLDKLAEGGATE